MVPHSSEQGSVSKMKCRRENKDQKKHPHFLRQCKALVSSAGLYSNT